MISRSGRGPRPRRATTRMPPTIIARLIKPQRKPQVSTDTSSSPYASMSAMNTPMRRLLKAASAMSRPRPGTAWMASSAPRTSTFGADLALGALGFGFFDVDRLEVEQAGHRERHAAVERPPHAEVGRGRGR